MKAWVQKSAGPFHDNLSLQESLELPKITEGDQILVQNFACSINPVDHKRGTLFASVCPFPSTSGCDAAGIVLEVGKDVDQEKICKPGDKIYYHTSIFQPYGTFATHSIALAAGVCRFPDQSLNPPPARAAVASRSFDEEKQEKQEKGDDNDDHDDDEKAAQRMSTSDQDQEGEASPLSFHSPVPSREFFSTPFREMMLRGAAVPCALWTSALALWDHCLNIQNGETVFIRGASGGTGVFAVQLAVRRGCTVIATCSGKNVEFVKSLGAHHVIDYTRNKVKEELAEILLSARSHSSSSSSTAAAGAAAGRMCGDGGVTKYLDCVSTPADESMKQMLDVIAFNGHAAFLLPISLDGSAAELLFAKGIHIHNVLWGGFMTNPSTLHLAREIIDRCNELLFGREIEDDKRLHVPISQFWKFDGIPEAVEMNQKGTTRGKAVVSI